MADLDLYEDSAWRMICGEWKGEVSLERGEKDGRGGGGKRTYVDERGLEGSTTDEGTVLRSSRRSVQLREVEARTEGRSKGSAGTEGREVE